MAIQDFRRLGDKNYRDRLTQLELDRNNNPIMPSIAQTQIVAPQPIIRPKHYTDKNKYISERADKSRLAQYNSMHIYNDFLDTETGQYVPIQDLARDPIMGGLFGSKNLMLYNRNKKKDLGMEDMDENQYLYPLYDPEKQRADGGKGDWIMAASPKHGKGGMDAVHNMGWDIYQVTGENPFDRSAVGNFATGFWNGMQTMAKAPLNMGTYLLYEAQLDPFYKLANKVASMDNKLGALARDKGWGEASAFDSDMRKWVDKYSEWMDMFGTAASSATASVPYSWDNLGEAVGQGAASVLQYISMGGPAVGGLQKLGLPAKTAFYMGMAPASFTLTGYEAYESAREAGLSPEDAGRFALPVGLAMTAIEMGGGNQMYKHLIGQGGTKQMVRNMVKEIGGDLSDEAIARATAKETTNVLTRLSGLYNRATSVPVVGSILEEGGEEFFQELTLGGAQILYDGLVNNPSINSMAETMGTPFGEGRFGKYYDSELWKEAGWSALVGGILGLTGGMSTLSHRKTGNVTIAKYVAADQERALMTEATSLLEQGIITPEKFEELKERVELFTMIKKDNKNLFRTFLSDQDYSKRVSDAINLLASNSEFVSDLLNSKEADPNTNVDLSNPVSPEAVLFNKRAVDNVLAGTDKEFRHQLRGAELPNYAEVLDVARTYYDNIVKKALKKPQYQAFSGYILNELLDRDIALHQNMSFRSTAQNLVSSIINKEQHASINEQSLRKLELQHRLKNLENTFKDIDKEIKTSENTQKVKSMFEYLKAQSQKKKEERTKEINAELETLKDVAVSEELKKVDKVYNLQRVFSDLEASDMKLSVSSDKIGFFDSESNVSTLLKELSEVYDDNQVREAEAAKAKAGQDQKNRNKDKNKGKNSKNDPNNYFMENFAEEDLKKVGEILANPDRYTAEEVDWAKNIKDQLDPSIGDYLEGKIPTLTVAEEAVVDRGESELMSLANENANNIRERRTTVTNLAYLHNKYNTKQVGSTIQKVTAIDPETGRIIQEEGADRRPALPNHMNVGTQLVLFVDKNYVSPSDSKSNYESLKNSLASIPIAIQTVEDYNNGLRPTMYLHDLSWVAKIDVVTNKLIKEGGYPQSDNVANGAIDQVFKETKRIRETLFATRDSKELSVYQTEITSKSNGFNNHSTERSAAEILKKDPRVFMAVRGLSELETSMTNRSVIPPQFDASTYRGVLYMLFPNAAGTYSITRAKQKPLESTPELHEKYSRIVTELIYDFITTKTYSKTIEELQLNINKYVYNSRRTRVSAYEEGLTQLEKDSRDIKKSLIFHLFTSGTEKNNDLFIALPHPSLSFQILRTEDTVDTNGVTSKKLYTTEYRSDDKLANVAEVGREDLHKIVKSAIRNKYPNVISNMVENINEDITAFDLTTDNTIVPKTQRYIDFAEENNVVYTTLEPIEVSGTNTYTSQPNIGINPSIYRFGETRVIERSPDEIDESSAADFDALVDGDDIAKDFGIDIPGDAQADTDSNPFSSESAERLGPAPKGTSKKSTTGTTDTSNSLGNIAKARQAATSSDLLKMAIENLDRLDIASFSLLKDTAAEDAMVKNLTSLYLRIESQFPRMSGESKLLYQNRILKFLESDIVKIGNAHIAAGRVNLGNTWLAVQKNFKPQLLPDNGRVFIGYGQRVISEIESLNFDLAEENELRIHEDYLSREHHAEDWHLKTDPEKSASARVRRFLYNLQMPTGSRTILGMNEQRDYAEVFNALLTQLHDIPINELGGALQDLGATQLEQQAKDDEFYGIESKEDPVFYQVWRGLNNRAAIEPSFRGEFLRVIHKHQNLMRTALIRRPKRETKYPRWDIANSNTRGSLGLIIDRWRNNFYITGAKTGVIIRDDENKTLRVNKTKAKALLNEFKLLSAKFNNTQEYMKDASEFLTKRLGIEITPAMLQSMNRDRFFGKGGSRFFKNNFRNIAYMGNGSVRQFFHSVLSPIIESLTKENAESDAIYKENNPFYDQTDLIGVLAKYYLRANPETYSSAFKDASGNTVYGFTPTSYATETFSDFTTSEPSFVAKKLENAYSKRSSWLAMVNQTDTKKKGTYRFEYSLFDASKNIEGYEGAKEFRVQSDRERETTRLNLYLNANAKSGHFLWITPGDKKNIPLITAPKIQFFSKIVGDMFLKGDIFLEKDPVLLDQLMDLLVFSEVDRINEVVKAFNSVSPENRKAKLKKGYHYVGNRLGAGSKFFLIPELNNATNSLGEPLIYVDPKTGIAEMYDFEVAEIRNFLANHFRALTKETVANWERLNVVNIRNGEAQIDFRTISKAIEKVDNDGHAFENAINKIAAEYVINYAAAMANISMLFTGDPALFNKVSDNWDGTIEGLITKTMSNLFKRTTKDIAPGEEGVWDKDNQRVNYIFVNEGRVSSEGAEYSEKLRSYMGNRYENIDLMDGQELITAEEYLNTLHAWGKIKTSIRNQILDKLKQGLHLNPFELKHLLNPQKPVFVGSEIWKYISDVDGQSYGHEEHYYIKPSSLPLIPQLTEKFPALDALRKEMERDTNEDGSKRAKVHRLVTDSTVKVGFGKGVDIFNEDGSLKTDIKFTEDNIISLSRRGFRLQQEVPDKPFKQRSVQGSQYSILQFADLTNNLTFNLSGVKDITPEQLYRLDGKINSELYRRKFENLIAQLGIVPIEVPTTDGSFTVYEPKDLNKLKNLLVQEAVVRQGWSYNDLLFLNVIDDVLTTRGQSFQIPLFFHPAINKIEALLNSVISNKVLKRDLPGRSLVQGTPAGFSDGKTTMTLEYALDTYREQLIFTKHYKPGQRLAYREDERGVYAEVLMPFYFKDKNGNPMRASDFINPDTGLLDESKISDDLLNILGYRIPTQGFSSMMRLKVVGFLPQTSSDLIIVPPEIFRQSGSDLDIDKLFTHNYNYIFDKAANTISKVATQAYSDFETISSSVNELSQEELENTLIDITFSIFEHPDVIREQLNPLDNTDIAEVIKEINEVAPKETRLMPSIINLHTQAEAVEMGSAGQIGIAIASLFSVGHVFRQYGNLYLGQKLRNIDGREELIDTPIFFLDDNGNPLRDLNHGKDFINNRVTTLSDRAIEIAANENYMVSVHTPYNNGTGSAGAWRFDKVYGFGYYNGPNGRERKKISRVIKNIQNASVDNASNPQLHELYLNPETMDLALTLASLGYDERYIGFFLRQPIIREYVNAKLEATSFIGDSFDKSSPAEFASRVYAEAGMDEDSMSVTGFSIKDLKESLRNGNSDKLIKAQILYNFIKWKGVAQALNDVQTTFNTQSKLLDKSIYSTVAKKENAKRFKSSSFIIKNADNLKDEDTVTGGAFEYGVSRGALLYNSDKLIPLNSAVLGSKGILGEISRVMGTIGELREDVVNMVMTDVRTAVYSSLIPIAFYADPDYSAKSLNDIRQDLLFGENSLANRLMEFKAISNNDFIQALRPILTEEYEEPNTVEFLAVRGMRDTDIARIQSAFLSLFKQPVGSEAYKMGRDLLIYSWLVGNERNAKDFGRFVPVDIYKQLGIDEHLFNINFRDLKGKSGGLGSLITNNFVRQWFQHNPFRAKMATSADITNAKKVKEGEPYSATNPIDRFELKSIHDPSGNTNELLVKGPEGGEIFTDYISIYDKVARRIYLYEKQYKRDALDTVEYVRIPTLGRKEYLIKEYDLHEDFQTSVIADNQEALIERRIQEKRTLGKVVEAQPKTSKETRTKITKGRDIALDHKFEKGAIDVLKSIEANGSSPEYKALATYLLSRKNRITGLRLEFYNPRNTEHWKDYPADVEYHIRQDRELQISAELKGRYLPKSNLVVVNAETVLNKADFEKTFLHELTHSYIDYLVQNEDRLSPSEKAAVQDLRMIVQELRERGDYIRKIRKDQEAGDNEAFDLLYGLGLIPKSEFPITSSKAVTEFIAVLMTNRRLQLDLNRMNHPTRRNFLVRIWNAITQLLGFSPRKNSLLAGAVDDILIILDNTNNISRKADAANAKPPISPDKKHPVVSRSSIDLSLGGTVGKSKTLEMKPDNIDKIKSGEKTVTSRNSELNLGLYELPDGTIIEITKKTYYNDINEMRDPEAWAKAGGFKSLADARQNAKFEHTKKFIRGKGPLWIYNLRTVSTPDLKGVEEFRGIWTRAEVANQSDKVFLFGDNTKDRTITNYIPSTTQAVIRGLPNAIGIDTKKDRGTSANSYLTDSDFNWFKDHVDTQIQLAKNTGKTIVIPADGIGTGKAALRERAPRLLEYLNQKLSELKELSENSGKGIRTVPQNIQSRSNQATKFIGRGDIGTTVANYASAWGENANSGVYTSEDYVYVMSNRDTTIDINELQKAMNAKATIILAPVEERKGNTGETQAASYLTRNGYVVEEGIYWIPKSEVTMQPKVASTPEIDPFNDEINEGYRSIFGDFFGDPTSDLLAPYKASNIDEVVERKKQVRKILYNKLSQKNANRAEITARIDRLDIQIKELEGTQRVTTLERQLAEDLIDINTLLNNAQSRLKNTLEYSEAHYIFNTLNTAGYFLDVWQNVDELIVYRMDKEAKAVIEKAYIEIHNQQKRKIELMRKAAVIIANNFSWKDSFTESEMFEGVRETGSITTNLYGIQHSNSSLVKVAHDMINSMKHSFNREYYTKRMEIDSKINKVVKDTGLSKLEIFDRLTQKHANGVRTGNLLYEFKQEYWDTIKKLRNEARESGKWSEYWDFMRKNTKPITDKMIRGEEQGFFTDEQFAKQQKLWEDFRGRRQAYKDILFSNPNLFDNNGNFISKAAERQFEYALILWDKTNSPVEYMKAKRGESKFRKNTVGREFIVTDVPTDNWIDSRYTELKKNKSLFEFYEYVYETFRENNALLPYKKGFAPNRIPELEKSFVEDVRDSNMFTALSGLAADLQGSLLRSPDNLVSGAATIGGRDVKFLPTLMQTNRLSAEEKSYDLEKLLFAHTAVAIGYKYKSQAEPIMNAMVDLIGTMKEGEAHQVGNRYFNVIDRLGNPKETNNTLANTKAHLEHTIDAIFYDNYKDKAQLFKKYTKEERARLIELQELIDASTNPEERAKLTRELGKLGKSFDGNTLIDGLNKYTYALGLGFPNVISPAINLFYGLISNFIYSAGSEYMTDANMWKGTMMMMGAVSRRAVTKLDAKQLMKIYGFMDSMDLLTHIVETSYNETNKIVSALVTLQSKAEYVNQGSMMIAILKTLQMKDKNGKDVSVWDAFTLNENNALVWNTELMGEEVPAAAKDLISKDGRNLNFNRLASVVKNEIKYAHGDYESIMIGKRKGWVRLLMLYKTWLPESIRHRFGPMEENPNTGKMEKGRYRSYIDSETIDGAPVDVKTRMWEFTKGLVSLSQKGNFKNFSELDRTNMARNAREMQFILMLTALVLLLKSAVDDDDEFKKYAYVLINAINRARADIQFYTNPNAFLQIIGSPVAAVNTLANAAKIVDVSYDTIMGEGTLQTGPYQGWPKMGKWAMSMTLGGSGVIRMINAGSKVHESR